MSPDLASVISITVMAVAALAYFAYVSRHAHYWGDPVKVAYATGTPSWKGELKSPDPKTFDRIVHGFVVYEQRCTRCGKTRTYEVLGRETRDDGA